MPLKDDRFSDLINMENVAGKITTEFKIATDSATRDTQKPRQPTEYRYQYLINFELNCRIYKIQKNINKNYS